MGLEPRPPALSLIAPTQGGSAGTHPLPPAQEGAPLLCLPLKKGLKLPADEPMG